jgi:acyl-coenzyme A thioesterase PaaI-like protein
MGDGEAASADTLAGLAALGVALPFNRHLGVTVRRVDEGHCEAVLPADPRLTNHLGGVHAIASLAPVELAGALAAGGRLVGLVERGYVPVVGSLDVRYVAPATGDLIAVGRLGPEVVDPALAAAEQGRKPHVEVPVVVTDAGGEVVLEARVTFVFLPPAVEPAGTPGTDTTA